MCSERQMLVPPVASWEPVDCLQLGMKLAWGGQIPRCYDCSKAYAKESTHIIQDSKNSFSG